MFRGSRQPLPPCLKAASLHHLHPRRHASQKEVNRPLYYTGYIRLSEVSRIQVDLGSAISIPVESCSIWDPHLSVEHHSENHLWLQRQWYAPDGKNQTQVPNWGPKIEVIYYVIDVDTSYNLLLGRPWIHHNAIIPSTLHHVMKYIGEVEKGER